MRCEGRRPGGKQARTSDRESWRGALGNASLTLALRRSVPRGGNEAGAALGAGGTAADVRAACAGNRTCAGGTEKTQVTQGFEDIPKRREDGRADSR